MEDSEIVALFWRRDETAILHTKERYGSKLRHIAYNILKNDEDAEESENDTYLKAWTAIPPQRPQYFFAYLAKICRNVSLHRYDWNNAQKRSAEFEAATDEIAQCIPDGTAEKPYEAMEIGEILSAFLRTLSKENRLIFLRRYLFADSVADISRRFHIGESKVKISLFRTRNKLKSYLEKEDIQA